MPKGSFVAVTGAPSNMVIARGKGWLGRNSDGIATPTWLLGGGRHYVGGRSSLGKEIEGDTKSAEA